MTTRVLVIGLDGATFDLIKPWVEQGELPVIEKLMEAGIHTPLKSVYPVLSSSAWPSFMTGVNPGKHSLVDFVRRKKGTYKLNLVQRTNIKSPTLWHILSEQGRKVCVVNVPMTYPPEPVNGFMITGLGTPLYKPFTYPEYLTERLKKQEYKVDKETFYHPSREKQYLKAVYETCESQLKVVKELLTEESWDFFMYVFRDTDELAHFFWKHMDTTHPLHNGDTMSVSQNTLLNFYKFVDKNIGELIKRAGEDVNVFVVSDHGFGPLYQDVFLNEWLATEGFLVKKNVDLRHRVLGKLGISRSKISDILRAMKLRRVENWIKDVLRERITLLPKDQRADFSDGIDWSHTLAYSFGYHGQIYLNLKGREPEGFVSEEEYVVVRESIINALKTLKYPKDNQLVVDRVFKREEIFSGPYLDKMPDLVVIMRNLSFITRNGYELGFKQGNIFCDPLTYESGSHRLEGILVACGTSIKKRNDIIQEANLTDLMPTILHLLGCTVPQGLDGQVMSAIFDENWIQRNQIRYSTQSELVTFYSDEEVANWDGEDEVEVMDRLKKLGYLN